MQDGKVDRGDIEGGLELGHLVGREGGTVGVVTEGLEGTLGAGVVLKHLSGRDSDAGDEGDGKGLELHGMGCCVEAEREGERVCVGVERRQRSERRVAK